jgi:uncharacterized protein YjiS (DUF1127 family)
MKGRTVDACTSHSSCTQGQPVKCLPNPWKRIARWYELTRQRHQLEQMSDAGLKDLGLSRADIYKEIERPFWDDPFCK